MPPKDRLYKVKEIVGFKQIGGLPHYKVHWESYSHSHDSWEPAINLKGCDSLIQEYHSHVSEPQQKRTAGARSTLPGDEEEENGLPTLRRSQRTRTPTRLFASETATPSPPPKPKGGTVKKGRAGSPRRLTRREEEQDAEEEGDTGEEGEELDFHRSEYQLRSKYARRQSPKIRQGVHNFNTGTVGSSRRISRREEEEDTGDEGEELDFHRSEYQLRSKYARRQSPRIRQEVHNFNTGTVGSSRRISNQEEEEDTGEEGEELDFHRSEYQLRSKYAKRRSPRVRQGVDYFTPELPQSRKTPPSNTILSSDEEEGGSGGKIVGGKGTRGVGMTPEIVESRVRQRLSALASLTRKSVSEALDSLTSSKTNKNDTDSTELQSSQPQSSPSVQPPPLVPARTYATRSRATPSHPTSSLLSTSTTTTTSTTAKMRTLSTSTTSTTRSRKLYMHSSTPPPLFLANKEPPKSVDAQEDDSSSTQSHMKKKYQMWAQFGWEEAIFLLIVIGLLLFAYYCFNSNIC